MKLFYISLLVVTALMNAVLQILLKYAAPSVLAIVNSSMAIPAKIFKLIINPYLLSVAFMMVGGVLLWFTVIAKTDLSKAYPVNIALTTIFTTVGALFLFREDFTLFKGLGIVLILLGLFFVLKY